MKISGKILRWLICLIALAYSHHALVAMGQQDNKPITRDNLISSIELGRREMKTAARYIELINLHGIDFRLTPDDEQKIRNVGKYLGRKGLDNLIAAIRSNYRVKKDVTPEFHGLLTPSNQPDPPSPCTRNPEFIVPPDAVTIYYGSSAAWITIPKHIVLRVEDAELLAISRTPEGVSVSAQIYGADGRIVAQIIDNEFHVNPNNYFRIDRTDKHALIVYDQYNKQVLNVRFLNPRSIKVTGIFHFRNIPPISIGEQEIIIWKERIIGNSCYGNVSIGISIG